MKKYVCLSCFGTRLEDQAWVDVNTLEFIGYINDAIDQHWCRDCEEFVSIGEIIDWTPNQSAYEFGKNMYYKKGDVVVWRGTRPCIITIKGFSKDYGLGRCYESYLENSHNGMHYSNLRPATREEINLLGDRTVLFINEVHKYKPHELRF